MFVFRSIACLLAVLSMISHANPGAAQGARTGIELVAGAGREEAPRYWTVYPLGSDEHLTYASGRWGYTPVPPGRYAVTVQWDRSEAHWGEVEVGEGEVARVVIDSGIEVVAGAGREKAPRYWTVYPLGSDEHLTYASGRWGYTPVPPGRYVVTVQWDRSEVRLREVEVGEGEVARVVIDSGIEVVAGAGREKAPRYWTIYPLGSDEHLTYASGRWGYTPVPPGRYAVTVQWDRSEAHWGEVEVGEGEVARVVIDSGIEVVAGAGREKAPRYWTVYPLGSGTVPGSYSRLPGQSWASASFSSTALACSTSISRRTATRLPSSSA